jgi:hypothetical protein
MYEEDFYIFFSNALWAQTPPRNYQWQWGVTGGSLVRRSLHQKRIPPPPRAPTMTSTPAGQVMPCRGYGGRLYLRGVNRKMLLSRKLQMDKIAFTAGECVFF